MIHLPKISLPADDAKAIKEWLGNPGAAAFARFLSLKAAETTALAGNALVSADEAHELEERKEVAIMWNTALEVFKQIRAEASNPEYTFLVTEFKPMPTDPEISL